MPAKARATSLTSFIRNKSFSQLIAHAEKIKDANTRLQHFLAPPLSGHVHVSNIKNNTLILLADSAVLSTRTQFLASEILNYMRNKGGLAMVERLKVKISLPQTHRPVKKRTIKGMSTMTSKLLESVALDIEDSQLSDVLKRLASHSNNRSALTND